MFSKYHSTEDLDTCAKRAEEAEKQAEKQGTLPDALRMVYEFAHARGDEGATESELEAVENWARGVLIAAATIELVKKGDVLIIDVREDGELVFAAAPVPPDQERLSLLH